MDISECRPLGGECGFARLPRQLGQLAPDRGWTESIEIGALIIRQGTPWKAHQDSPSLIGQTMASKGDWVCSLIYGAMWNIPYFSIKNFFQKQCPVVNVSPCLVGCSLGDLNRCVVHAAFRRYELGFKLREYAV